MLNLMTEVKTVYSAYSSTIFPLVLALIAIVYLLVKAKPEHMNLLLYELIIFFLLVTPGIANLLWKYKSDAENVHLIWGICIPIVLSGVVATDLYLRCKTKWAHLGAVVFMIILLWFGVGLDFSGNHITLYANSERVGAEIVQIAESLKLAKETPVRLLAPTEVATSVRECDDSLIVLYGEGLGYTPWNPEQLLIEADAYAANCLVISREYEQYGYEEYYLDAGFLKLLQTEHYVVYTRE